MFAICLDLELHVVAGPFFEQWLSYDQHANWGETETSAAGHQHQQLSLFDSSLARNGVSDSVVR